MTVDRALPALTVAGVIVVFSRLDVLREIVGGVRSACSAVLVIDNRPEGGIKPEIDGAVWLENRNRGGLAGAYNRALAWLREQRPDVTHVMWVDEDSQTDGVSAFFLDPEVQRQLASPQVAAIAPAYRECRTQLRGRHLQWVGNRLRYLDREDATRRAVAFLINSRSVWRRDALARLGTYDEGLAVDHIDTDMCLRARRIGLDLILFGNHEFSHRIGHRRAYQLGRWTLQSTGHDPQRRYSLGRTTAALVVRHGGHSLSFAALCTLRLGYEAIGILVTEDRKVAKLFALVRGVVRGLQFRAD